MNEDKTGHNPPPDPKKDLQNSGNGDMLDRWIEQNLHIQGERSGSTAQPVSNPTKNTSKPHPKPTHLGQLGQKPAPVFAKKQPQPIRTPPPVGTPQLRTQPQSKHPAPNQRNRHQPPKSSPGTGAKGPFQPSAKSKGFFGIFNRAQGASQKNANAKGQALHSNRSGSFASHSQFARPNQATQSFQGKLRIIPFGGLDEVGKNCMGLEYVAPGASKSEIILIDLGFQFPEEDMLGVDYVIPDLSYLEDKIDRIRGIVFTHGHLDHIGAVPYLMQKLNFPLMYGTKLTMGLVEKRLEEFGLLKQSKIQTITAQDTLQLGPFHVSFFHVNHSIPDAVGVVVKTPAGNIVHTGDFKFDHTPSGDQKPADFARIASLSGQNIAALFIDSTNALKAGHTITEKKIGESLEGIIKNYEGRIIIASFSSQIGRIQQIVNAAKKYGRTIFLSGRSLIDNVFMASELGYLKIPQGLVHDIKKAKKIPEHKVLILTTGSQGEDVSALTRMALEEHQAIKIKKGDTVVLSSSPIPGNERAITTVTNNLCRLGASIINNQIMDVHTSGHAQQEDLKLMMSLVKAKYVVPVHGEYYMRFGNKEVAMSLGYDEKNAVIVENGDVLEIVNNEVKVTGEKVENKYILVDGLGVGDIGAQVMMDRQTLAENGVLIIIVPIDEKSRKLKGEIDIISRGFIYMKESEELVNAIKGIAKTAYQNIQEKRADLKRAEVKKYLKESIDKFVHQKIERHPLVLPVLIEK